jgi:hypothetical protein
MAQGLDGRPEGGLQGALTGGALSSTGQGELVARWNLVRGAGGAT